MQVINEYDESMIRTTFTTAALAFAAAFTSAPVQAEIVKAECKLSKYGDTPRTEIFPCEFRQSAGNAQIWSKNWNFEFLAVDQGKTYVRINSNPLSFHCLGKYSLFVFQNGMPAQEFER
ncbi:putative conserved secreted protein [Synechococcus sp. SYN20]|nr:putative conserved secreted protein [Synechococcus sp. SYN20]